MGFFQVYLLILLGRQSIMRHTDEGHIAIIQRSIVYVSHYLKTKVIDITVTLCFESG